MMREMDEMGREGSCYESERAQRMCDERKCDVSFVDKRGVLSLLLVQ
jgi:hypothetical protein